MTGNKLNFALCGAGGMGRRWAGVLARSKKATLRVVVDIDAGRALELAKQYNALSAHDLNSVLNDPKIDAALVALPHKFLASTSISLLNKKKHVLCEKPGAISVAEFSKVTEAAKKQKRTLVVGSNHRFHPSHIKAKELLDRGAIGELLFMRGCYGFGGRVGYGKEWRHKKELGGGELIDQGVHLIDLARWFLGDIVEVKSFLQNAFWKSDVEDNVFLLLKDIHGRIASIHASWSQWKPKYLLELIGSKGYITIEGLGKRYGGTERVYFGKRSKDFRAGKEKIIECDTNADKSLEKLLNEFINSIKEGRDPSPSSKDALEALKIVEAAYTQQK
jgi:predicted dehydrogenase